MRVRTILEHPLVYQYFQMAGGFFGARARAIERFLPIAPGERVADIGCGPGFIVEVLPGDISYYGFDTDQRYIMYANSRFGDRGRFFCEPFDQHSSQREGPFDVVMLNGLLHHLTDAEVTTTLGAIRNSLRRGGRLFTLDGCYVSNQATIPRLMLEYDRGDYVRTAEQYRALVESSFESIELHIDHGLSWFPYTWICMVARNR